MKHEWISGIRIFFLWGDFRLHEKMILKWAFKEDNINVKVI